MGMVRRVENDVREITTARVCAGENRGFTGKQFFDMTIKTSLYHTLKDKAELDVFLYAARQVQAHVFEAPKMDGVPDGGHTFIFWDESEKKDVYYYMHFRDSYLMQLWVLDRIRGQRVGCSFTLSCPLCPYLLPWFSCLPKP